MNMILQCLMSGTAPDSLTPSFSQQDGERSCGVMHTTGILVWSCWAVCPKCAPEEEYRYTAMAEGVSEGKGTSISPNIWVNTHFQAYYNVKRGCWCVLAVCRTGDGFAEKQSPLLSAGSSTGEHTCFVLQQLDGNTLTNTVKSSIIRQWCTYTCYYLSISSSKNITLSLSIQCQLFWVLLFVLQETRTVPIPFMNLNC